MMNDKLELAKLLEEKAKRIRYNRLDTFFPDEGPYRRELYPKHVEFMEAGALFSQRAAVAANRTGKTIMAAYEVTLHATGLYPKWWKGRRFDSAVAIWVAGINNQTTREIIQVELCGDMIDLGSGMIPKAILDAGKFVRKSGVQDAIETLYIPHVAGGFSRIDFKAYEQGPETFQGTKKQVIWLDEEPKNTKIYSECLTRTMDRDNPGLLLCTFTPLFGLSDVVLSFLPGGVMPPNGVNPDNPYKFVTMISWDEVPHITDKDKKERLASYHEYERKARSTGMPGLGAGSVYPYPEEDIVVDPFEIPIWFPKAYGLDVGWNKTAAVWGALDPSSGIIYLYSEHYEGQQLPAIHASGIKARGEWIPGVIDPRGADNRSQIDGTRLIDLYQQEGLDLGFADNSVDAGVYAISQLFAAGKLKIFSSLKNLMAEFRVYRRDENGKIVKKHDHLMDAMRYLIMSGMSRASTSTDTDEINKFMHDETGRSKWTGY